MDVETAEQKGSLRRPEVVRRLAPEGKYKT